MKSKSVKDPTYLYLDLIIDSDRYKTSEEDPEDSWSRGNTTTYWSVEGIRLRLDRYSTNVDFPVERGDKVYVVYAVYSRGDSFGYDSDGGLKVISFHKNLEVAKKNRDAAEASTSSDLVIEFDSGKVVTVYAPWHGHFESLSYVKVEEFMVQ